MHVQERVKPKYFSTWYIDCDNLIKSIFTQKKFEQSKYRNLIKKFDPISRGVGYVAEISNDEIIPTKIKSFIEILFYNYFISLSM